MTNEQKDFISDMIEFPAKHPVKWVSTTIGIGIVFFGLLYFLGV